MAAAFSAIIIVGELVLPEVIDGITEASATRKPSMPITLQPRVDHRIRIVGAAHAGGADGVKNGGADVARRLHQCGFVVVAHLRARQIFDRRIWPQRRLRHDFARDADRVGGDAFVFRRRQVIRPDRGSRGRID